MPSAARAARNENVFREVNEQIHNLESQFGGNPAPSFVCECTQSDCTTRIDASLEEYRAVRSADRRFLVARGHVDPDVELVICSTDRFSVVEKVGRAGELAAAEAPAD